MDAHDHSKLLDYYAGGDYSQITSLVKTPASEVLSTQRETVEFLDLLVEGVATVWRDFREAFQRLDITHRGFIIADDLEPVFRRTFNVRCRRGDRNQEAGRGGAAAASRVRARTVDAAARDTSTSPRRRRDLSVACEPSRRHGVATTRRRRRGDVATYRSPANRRAGPRHATRERGRRRHVYRRRTDHVREILLRDRGAAQEGRQAAPRSGIGIAFSVNVFSSTERRPKWRPRGPSMARYDA